MFKKIGIALALSVASILPAVANEPGDLYIGEYGSEGCGDAIYCSVEIGRVPGGYNFTYQVTDKSEAVLCRDYGNLVEYGGRLIGQFGVHRGDLIWVRKEGGSILVEKTTDQPCLKSFPVNGRYWMFGN